MLHPRVRTSLLVATFVLLGAGIGVGASIGLGGHEEPTGVDCPGGTTGRALDRVVPGVTSTPLDDSMPLPDVELREIVDDLASPTSVATAPNGRDLWITEKAGRVIELRPDGSHRRVALDLTERVVSDGGEQGLLSTAVLDETHVAVYFTGRDDDVHVQVLTLGPSGGIVASRELLHVDKPARTHNGGTVTRGPGDLLYVAVGDGGGRNDPGDDAQSCVNFLGKVLSVDPEIAHGATEPGDPGVRILAWGLRNPYRFSFDPEGGAFYVGDVGQRRIEEIDAVPSDELHGINFGWDAFEGNARFERSQLALGALVWPVSTARHPRSCSVVGGVVYRGRDIPALVGTYLYADFCQTRLRGLRLRDGRIVDELDGTGTGLVSGFGTGPDDEVYAVSLAGTLLRVSTAAAPPRAAA